MQSGDKSLAETERPLGALEGEGFQALAQKRNEDDLGRDEILPQPGGCHAGDCQGDIRPDRALKEGNECQVDDTPTADQRGDQRQRHAKGTLPGASSTPRTT